MIKIEDVKIDQCFITESKSYNMHSTKYQLLERTDRTILLRDVDRYGLITFSTGATLFGDKENVRYITSDFMSKYQIIELI